MARMAAAMVLLSALNAAHGQSPALDDVLGRAMAGDYQAQRNLAYGYSSAPYDGQARSAVLACAWRQVIAASGHPRVSETDVRSLQVYCSLPNDQKQAATRQAQALYRKVYGRAMP